VPHVQPLSRFDGRLKVTGAARYTADIPVQGTVHASIVSISIAHAFALILIGDEYLLGQLQLRNHRALCSRLSAHHLLSPWTLEEIQAYLTLGLEAVGIHRSKVFEPAAVDLLVRATAGVPRSVCLLARAAWLEAARAEASEINAQTLQLALEQVPGLAGLTRHNS
jgi:hypothetical protein